MPIGQDETARIEAALAAVQVRTSSQIVCVLARASSSYELMPLVWSILLGLASPWPMLVFTHLSAERIYLTQLVIFFAALAILSLTPLGILMTPRSVQRGNAHRAALGQFMIRGLSHSAARGNILIFVSMAEHYGRIVADDGAAQAISQDQWQTVVDKMLADIKRGNVDDGLIAAASRCADLLAPKFPPGEGDAQKPPRRHFHVV
jgi:putative membrane protein